MLLLSTKTISNQGTVDFTSEITSAYDAYQFEFENVVPVTGNAYLYMRISTGGTFQSSSYLWQTVSTVSAATDATHTLGTSSVAAGTNSEIRLTGESVTWAVSNSSTVGVNGFAKLANPNSTTSAKHTLGQTSYLYTGAAQAVVANFSGLWTGVSAVDQVRFAFNSGNLSTGKIRCYGIPTS